MLAGNGTSHAGGEEVTPYRHGTDKTEIFHGELTICQRRSATRASGE
jgi:hypothetical protein